MKRREHLRLFILSAMLTGLLAGCQTNPLQKNAYTLQAADVKRLFSGHTVESYNLNTKNTSFTFYDAKGRALQERLWARRTGSRKVTADGQICLSFDNKEPRCRHIVREGERYYKVLPDRSGRLVHIVRYRYFSPANALNKK